MPLAFQSTHPHGVRPDLSKMYVQSLGFQSTHPHGVRHIVKLVIGYTIVFQSTHPHGVRPSRSPRRTDKTCFNPRTHTGCDGRHTVYNALKKCFNPRTHTGCDLHDLPNVTLLLRFNPRTHTGCDTLACGIAGPTCGFNPRTHTGCDQFLVYLVFNTLKFQSTHPHGVRRCVGLHKVSKALVSIHAPTRGATYLHCRT